jgi:hypothetical protein
VTPTHASTSTTPWARAAGNPALGLVLQVLSYVVADLYWASTDEACARPPGPPRPPRHRRRHPRRRRRTGATLYGGPRARHVGRDPGTHRPRRDDRSCCRRAAWGALYRGAVAGRPAMPGRGSAK